jgi:hypothetical protein
MVAKRLERKFRCCVEPIQACTDILSNTAQVLTSLVDALTSASTRDTSNIEPLPLLEESLELFQRCLALQEFHYSESQAQAEEAMDTADPSQDSMEIPDSEDGGVSLSSGPPSSAQDAEAQQDERWATIIEPVTNETLLDTLLAQLETLTTLCNLLVNDSGRGLSFIEEYSNPLLTLKLPTYLNGATPDRTIEAGVTRANFICALADANFRSQRTDIATYYRAVESAWQGIDLSSHAEGLVNAAESLVTYNTSLRSNLPSSETAVAESRWKALTAAQETLTSASKLPAVENIAKIYLVRGDVELLRWQLGQGKYSLAIAEKSGSVLLSNAGKYYRGGGAYARTTGEKKELFESQVKNALAKGLAGDAQALKDLVSGGGQIGEILAEAVDDGVVEGAHLSVMGIN